jgi:hypothetical protein
MTTQEHKIIARSNALKYIKKLRDAKVINRGTGG